VPRALHVGVVGRVAALELKAGLALDAERLRELVIEVGYGDYWPDTRLVGTPVAACVSAKYSVRSALPQLCGLPLALELLRYQPHR
jgi:hypothetical protein